MTKPISIVVPTDFSNISRAGLKTALRLADRILAEIYLVHWIKPTPGVTITSTGELNVEASKIQDVYTLKLIEAQRDKLLRRQQKYQSKNTEIQVILKMDNMVDGLEELVQELNAGLVVMGTSGERNFEEQFTGNRTEQVIRRMPCPVLTVKKFKKKLNFHEMILAVDLGERSEAIAKVVSFAKMFDARLHLLFVNDSAIDKKKEAIVQLKLIAAQHQITRYTLNYVQDSDEVGGIRGLAEIKNAGLIAVFTENHSFFTDLFTTDIAESLVSTAKRPVLTLNLDELAGDEEADRKN